MNIDLSFVNNLSSNVLIGLCILCTVSIIIICVTVYSIFELITNMISVAIRGWPNKHCEFEIGSQNEPNDDGDDDDDDGDDDDDDDDGDDDDTKGTK